MSRYQEGYQAGFTGAVLGSCRYTGAELVEWMQGYYDGRDRRETARTRRFR